MKTNSPFIFLSRYMEPGNNISNVKNILYIGYKPEAEKDEYGEFLDFDNSKNFDIKEHISYLDKRKGSHGLFGKYPNYSPDIEKVTDQIMKHQGFSWQFIVSLREDDAKEYGYTDRKAWEDAIRQSMPKVANAMGIRKENSEWVAAFHNKPGEGGLWGHPHCHLVVWEKKPESKKGKINTREVKKTFANEIFADAKRELNIQKTMSRDILKEKTKNDTAEMVRFMKNIKENELEVKALFGEKKTVFHPYYMKKKH